MTPNRGQWDEKIQYSIDLNQGKMYLENQGMTYFLTDALAHNHSEGEHHHNHSEEGIIHYHAIKQQLIGSNSNPSKSEKNPSKHYSNYFIGF
jgi:hypothetical protein